MILIYRGAGDWNRDYKVQHTTPFPMGCCQSAPCHHPPLCPRPRPGPSPPRLSSCPFPSPVSILLSSSLPSPACWQKTGDLAWSRGGAKWPTVFSPCTSGGGAKWPGAVPLCVLGVQVGGQREKVRAECYKHGPGGITVTLPSYGNSRKASRNQFIFFIMLSIGSVQRITWYTYNEVLTLGITANKLH